MLPPTLQRRAHQQTDHLTFHHRIPKAKRQKSPTQSRPSATLQLRSKRMETWRNNRAWSQLRCSCEKCGQVLRAYLQDPNSIYPMGAEMQPMYKIANPLKSRSKQPTRYEREKQIYFRVARALGVANAAKKKEIRVSVVHYTRWSIENYNNDASANKPRFQFYLTPNDMNNTYLQRHYAVEDKFKCIDLPKSKQLVSHPSQQQQQQQRQNRQQLLKELDSEVKLPSEQEQPRKSTR